MKTIRKMLCAFTITALLFPLQIGCSQKTETVQIKEDTAVVEVKKAQTYRKTYKVGVSLQDYSPFVLNVCNRLVKLVGENDQDIELVIFNANGDPNTQVAHIESFVSSGIDAIILDPISYEDCAMAVKIAEEAGLPLITTITKTINSDEYGIYVGSDHYESGVIEANMVVDYLDGAGNIVILEGYMGIDAQKGRYRGYMDVFAGYPDIHIVAMQTAAWNRNEAYAIVENWIRNDKDFSVILAENDNMAMGAIQAIEELGVSSKYAVFGIDGDRDAIEAVKDGRLEGTVYHNAEQISQTLYNCIVSLKTSEEVSTTYIIPFEKVTRENADAFLD